MVIRCCVRQYSTCILSQVVASITVALFLTCVCRPDRKALGILLCVCDGEAHQFQLYATYMGLFGEHCTICTCELSVYALLRNLHIYVLHDLIVHVIKYCIGMYEFYISVCAWLTVHVHLLQYSNMHTASCS